jgi:hypothetical protein
MFFRFPPDARWNPDRITVEFGIGVGEYEGVVRAFPGASSKSCYWKPSRLNAASKPTIFTGRGSNSSVRRKQLTDDGNVEITGRDMREREIRARHARPIGYRRAAS